MQGEMDLHVRIVGDESSGAAKSLPTQQLKISQQEISVPVSPLSLSSTSSSRQAVASRRRRLPPDSRRKEELSRQQGKPFVVVRVRPMEGKRKNNLPFSSQSQCCIRPILTRQFQIDGSVVDSDVDSQQYHRRCHRQLLNANKAKLTATTNTELSRIQHTRKVLSQSYKDNQKPPKQGPSGSQSKEKRNQTGAKQSLLRCTSLIAGTENKIRFDYDQVIGPRVSQAQCYEHIMGDTVAKNFACGVDTTIISVGHDRSGKSYTISGGWKFDKTATTDDIEPLKLKEEDGILPRAVFELFHVCERYQLNLPQDSHSAKPSLRIMMAFYTISCSTGKTFDLLSSIDSLREKTKNGITWVPVNSPLEVKKLMEKASRLRAPEVHEKRCDHMFCTFRVVQNQHIDSEGTNRLLDRREISLSIVKLVAREDITACDNYTSRKVHEDYNLRELLERLCLQNEQDGAKKETSVNESELFSRLDDILLDNPIPVVICCVSPLQRTLEKSIVLLCLVAMATKSQYWKKESLQWPPISQHRSFDNSFSSSDTVSTLESITNLHKYLKEANDATKKAEETSQSLDAAATRWRIHREKLNSATTLTHISNTVEPNKHAGERKSNGQGQTSKASRKSLRHSSRLLTEKEIMNEKLGSMEKKASQQNDRIESLEFELCTMHQRLEEEQQVSAKLEKIRGLLRKKSILEGDRIRKLEEQLNSVLESRNGLAQELKDINFVLDGERRVRKRSEEVQILFEKSSHSMSNETNKGKDRSNMETIRYKGVSPQHGYQEIISNAASPIHGVGVSNSPKVLPNEKCFSLLHDSSEVSIYFDAEEAASSEMSNETMNFPSDSSPPNSFPCVISGAMASPSHTSAFINEDDANLLPKIATCHCQSTMFSSNDAKKIEFYLPNLSISCFCGKQQSNLLQENQLGELKLLLRQWQIEFLASIGITNCESFLEEYRKDEAKLALCMIRWRAKKGLAPMPKRSCTIALLIWSRACAMAIRSTSKSDHEPTKRRRPEMLELLELSSVDSGGLASLG